MFSTALKDLGGGLSLWHVWLYQAYHEISAKYKRTIMGSLWIVGSMTFTSIAMALVFGTIFGSDLKEFLPYVMGGIIAFGLIGTILNESPEVYMNNGGIIRNHAYPFSYYSFESVAKNLLLLMHNVVVLEIALAIFGRFIIPHWTLLIGLPLACLNVFTWGSLVSMMASRYRDLRFLLPYMSQIVVYMCPIMYHSEQVKGTMHLVVENNPFYPFVEMIRAPLLGTYMPLHLWPLAAGITVAGMILWLIFFNMFRNRIAFWV